MALVSKNIHFTHRCLFQRLNKVSTLTQNQQACSLYTKSVSRMSALLHISTSETEKSTPTSENEADSSYGSNSAATVLLNRHGFLQHSHSGVYGIMPLMQRSLDKLTNIIEILMKHAIGSQKLTLPLTNPAHLWSDSGRLELMGKELLVLKDRHLKSLVLAPTHEEAITNMLANLYGSNFPTKKLPMRMHQISTKFRDERRPRYGLLRGREFLMNDLYIFDANMASAKRSYNAVRAVYRYLFNHLLGIQNLIECKGSAVAMGGLMSHEFFLPVAHGVGEDTVYYCTRAMQRKHSDEQSYAVNKELLLQDNNAKDPHLLCADCPSSTNGGIENCPHVCTDKAIELAHAFIIGDKYSRLFNLNCGGSPLLMSCYGIGVTRVLQAVVETSAAETGTLRWPRLLAPFSVCFIGPKHGSKEEKRGAADVLNDLMQQSVDEHSPLSVLEDVLHDDRSELTIGNRVRQLQTLGIPLLVVCGKHCVPDPKTAANNNEPKVELLYADRNYHPQLVSIHEAVDAVRRQLIQPDILPKNVVEMQQTDEQNDEKSQVSINNR